MVFLCKIYAHRRLPELDVVVNAGGGQEAAVVMRLYTVHNAFVRLDHINNICGLSIEDKEEAIIRSGYNVLAIASESEKERSLV